MTLDSRIAELEEKASLLHDLEEAAKQLPQLQAQRATRDRQAQAAQMLETTAEVTREAVEQAKADLSTWRDEFMSWTERGQLLARRLHELEQGLLGQLAQLATVARDELLSREPPRTEEEGIFYGTKIAAAMATAFYEVGVDDNLMPWPREQGAWARGLTDAMISATAPILDPAHPTVLFVKQ